MIDKFLVINDMGKQQFTEIQKAKILLAISIKPTLERHSQPAASRRPWKASGGYFSTRWSSSHGPPYS